MSRKRGCPRGFPPPPGLYISGGVPSPSQSNVVAMRFPFASKPVSPPPLFSAGEIGTGFPLFGARPPIFSRRTVLGLDGIRPFRSSPPSRGTPSGTLPGRFSTFSTVCLPFSSRNSRREGSARTKQALSDDRRDPPSAVTRRRSAANRVAGFRPPFSLRVPRLTETDRNMTLRLLGKPRGLVVVTRLAKDIRVYVRRKGTDDASSRREKLYGRPAQVSSRALDERLRSVKISSPEILPGLESSVP